MTQDTVQSLAIILLGVAVIIHSAMHIFEHIRRRR